MVEGDQCRCKVPEVYNWIHAFADHVCCTPDDADQVQHKTGRDFRAVLHRPAWEADDFQIPETRVLHIHGEHAQLDVHNSASMARVTV